MAAFQINGVSSATQLSEDIAAIDQLSQEDGGNGTQYVITLAAGATLTESADMDAINLAGSDTLTINGQGAVLDGDGNSALFAYAGTVTINNLTVEDATAHGGAGGGDGGGGAGLGGGLFVASGASVTLNNLAFVDDSAVGGNGGAAGSPAGGGGGMGGNGGLGSGGGGGGLGASANGGRGVGGNQNGGAGIVVGAASGGSAINETVPNATGGVNGGGGGANAAPHAPGGGGGIGGSPGNGGIQGEGVGGGGGFGGGGGGGGYESFGGAGGFGGGGGGGGFGFGASSGGPGGFGGGGGASGYGGAANGGFGGGAGAGGVIGVGFGGGGMGAGGDIFVMAGASLTIEGGSLGSGTVTGGAGADGLAGNGAAFGSGIFLQGDETIALGTGQTAGQTTSVSGVIADEHGSVSSDSNMGSLTIAGLGMVDLTAANTFAGGVTLDGGTLELGANSAAGSGAISFAGGGVVLELDSTLTLDGTFANTLTNIAIGDEIDLAGLTYVAGATSAVASGGVLTVSNGTTSEQFTLSNAAASLFTVQNDGANGTLVTGSPIVLSGFTTDGAISDLETIAPFSAVAISDSINGDQASATIAFAAANGTLSGSGLSAGVVSGETVTYSLSATTVAALQAELQALTFTPTAYQGAAGTTVITAFDLTVADAAATVSDATTSVAVTETARPVLTLGGFTTNGSISDTETIGPFSAVTVSDSIPYDQVSATVSFAAANGGLSGSGLSAGVVSGATATYSLAPTSAAALQAALRALTFTPTLGADGATVTTAFDLTVSDVPTSPPTMPSATLSSGISNPVSVATDAAGDVFVANQGADTVEEFSSAGVLVQTLSSGISEPSSVATDPSGDDFVANLGNNTVEEFSPAGGILRTLSSGIDGPISVATDGAGDVFVANYLNNTVEEFSSGGALVQTLTSGISEPYSLATDAAGDVFVANSGSDSVEEFSPGGALVRTLTSGIDFPSSLATDAAGDVFVANADDSTVEEFSNSGAPLQTLSGLSDPQNLATDGAGDVFVANGGNGTVEEFSPAGALLRTLSSGIIYPDGLATDAAGDVFVADYINNVVEEFSPIGVTTVSDDSTNVTVTPAPPVITAGAAVTYTQGGAPVEVDSGLSVADADSNILTGATITINAGFLAGDTLYGGDLGGLGFSWDSTTGVLALSGVADLATYQAALESITFSSSSLNPTDFHDDPSRTISWQVTDSNGLTSAPATSTVDIIGVDQPPVLAGGGNTATYTYGFATAVDGGVQVSDPDNLNLAGATVAIGSGFQSGDALNFTNQNGITGNYDATTGVLTLAGTASVADYQAALASVTFSTLNDTPTARTVSWQVTDGTLSSNEISSTVDIAYPPPLITASAIASYIGGTPADIDAGLGVSDVSPTLTGATVTISSGLLAGDALNFLSQSGIAGSYDATTGVLTLAGTARITDYQTALESITFSSTSLNPTDSGADPSRTISWQVTDSNGLTSAPAASTVDLLVLAGGGNTVTYAVGGAAAIVDGGIQFSGLENVDLGDATAAISSGFEIGDELNFTNQNGITGSYDATSGLLTLAGNANVADYQAALASVTFSTSSSSPTARTVSWQFTSGIFSSNEVSSTVDIAPPPTTVSVATFLSEQSSLDALPGGFSISDTALDVAMSLDQLNADTHINSIALTDGGTPTLTLSIEEALNDTRALSEITSPYTLALADTAADIELITLTQAMALQADGYKSIASTTGAVALTIAEATLLSGDGIAVTGAPVVVSGTAAAMEALSTAEASTLVGEGYTLAILDTAANIRAMTVAEIKAVSALGVTQIAASDMTMLLRVAQVAALEAGGIVVSAPSGDSVVISGTAAHLESLTATEIGGLAAIGVTGLVSTNANVSYSPTQTAAILSSGLNVSALGAHTVTENFADGAYSVAHFNMIGRTYSSYEDIYNSAATLVAVAQNNVGGSGKLILSANGLATASSAGSESVTIGSDTFPITRRSVETVSAVGWTNETFVYGAGFGQDALSGFRTAGASHDTLQFSASMFGFSTPTSPSQQATDAQALLSDSSFASGTTSTVITDQGGDTLTLNGITIAALQAHLPDFKFT
jgi:hypothetical protein